MRRVVLACTAVLLLLAPAAHAYVLPADFLLKLLAEKRRKLALKDVTAQLTAELAGVDTPVDERLYLKQPERLRWVSQAEDTPTLIIEREGSRAVGPENALTKDSGPATDVMARLLFPNGKEVDDAGARMLAAVKGAGIDTSIVGLGRDGDEVVYIIGARAFEPDKPQLWLYKATFLPARLVTVDKTKSPLVKYEARYRDYGSASGGDYLPGVIEQYVDGKRVRRAELTKVTVNQDLPETLFDLPKR